MILAILFQVFFSLVMHDAGQRRCHLAWVGAINYVFAALVLLTGGIGLGLKTFDVIGSPALRWAFLAVLFAAAAAGNVPPLLKDRRRPGISDWWHGLALGVTNILNGIATLAALDVLPAIVFFPVSSAAGVILTTWAAVAFWKEKLTRVRLAGMAVAVIAVVLVNLR